VRASQVKHWKCICCPAHGRCLASGVVLAIFSACRGSIQEDIGSEVFTIRQCINRRQCEDKQRQWRNCLRTSYLVCSSGVVCLGCHVSFLLDATSLEGHHSCASILKEAYSMNSCFMQSMCQSDSALEDSFTLPASKMPKRLASSQPPRLRPKYFCLLIVSNLDKSNLINV